MPRKRTAAPPGEEDWIKDAAVAAAETAIEQGGMTGSRSLTTATTITTTTTSKASSSAPNAQSRTATKEAAYTTTSTTPKPKKPSLTHFLCLPLVTPSSRPRLLRSINEFIAKLCDDGESERVPRSAIRPVGTLHLTLGVMSLQGARLEGALKMLRGLGRVNPAEGGDGKAPGTHITPDRTPSEVQVSSSEADTKPADSTPSTPEPLVISLTGLRTFRTPRKASVLFADPTDTTGRLQALGERLRELFMTAGYIIDEGRPLTLHATVIRMGSSKAGQGKEKAKTAAPEAKGAGARAEVPESKVTPAAARKRKRAQPATLDATELIEEFRDFVWAEEIRVERVAICKMGAKKIIGEGGEVVDEEYEVVEAVDIPAGWL